MNIRKLFLPIACFTITITGFTQSGTTRDILDYDCAERMACSSEECQEDHFALRKRSLYSHVRSYGNDLREYARQIAPGFKNTEVKIKLINTH